MKLEADEQELVDISLEDLVVLALGYILAAKSDDIGELGLHSTVRTLLNDIDLRSDIRVTNHEIENVLYHFKQVALENKDLTEIKPRYIDYIKITQRLRDLNPTKFAENPVTKECEII